MEGRHWCEDEIARYDGAVGTFNRLLHVMNVVRINGINTNMRVLRKRFRDVGDGRMMGQPDFAPERSGEVRRSCLDVGRAERELGWQARVELREGLRTILAGL